LIYFPNVPVTVDSQSSVGRYYLEEFDSGGLFVPGVYRLDVGDEVCVDVGTESGRVMQFISLVRWQRHSAAPRLPAGLGVEFRDPEAKIALARFTQGAPHLTERARRIYARVLVQFEHRGKRLRGVTGDLSDTGLFVISPDLLPAGSEIDITLTAPERSPVSLRGFVQAVRIKPRAGMGVSFAPGTVTPALRDLVADLTRRATLRPHPRPR